MVMAQPVQYWNLGIGALTCHAWNKDRSQVAVSPNNNEVHIFEWKAGKWNKIHVLAEHDLPVTGIDWGQNTNRIVTCSQDKNAFVWTLDGNVWKPELVLCRLTRSATCVKWSPSENKFAIGSGARLLSVCYYEKENDWWVSKQIKKPIKSSVTSLAWHPNNVLLAVGACDFKTRVFSAYVKEVDDKPAPTPWGTKMPFNQLMCEWSNGGGGWVHDVRFSPSGCRLAWVGHDSSLSVVDSTDRDNQPPSPDVEKNAKIVTNVGSITTVKEWYLPFTCVEWMTENSIVASGYECCPLLFAFTGPGQLKFVSKLDVPSQQTTNTTSAMDMFRKIDRQATKKDDDTKLKTLHQNTISYMCAHTGQKNSVTKFSTSGLDGLLVLWDLKGLEAKVASINVI